MKTLIIFFACLGSFMVNAQATYTMEQHNGHGLTAVYAGSIDKTDVDADGDQDILISGVDTFVLESPPIFDYGTFLFLNNGSGVYTISTNNDFPQNMGGLGAFADVNGDTYPDIYLDVSDENGTETIGIYLNDGSGGFSYDANYSQNLVGPGSAVAFGDIDGDNDLDLIAQGSVGGGQVKTLMYENHGGTFTEIIPSVNFEDVFGGSITIFDYNNDGDNDVLLTGSDNVTGGFANLYENDGTGNFLFTLVPTPFTPVSSSSTAVHDIDNDGDMDVALGGSLGGTNGKILETYRNNGDETFTLIQSLNGGIENGSIAFGDSNRDGFPDLLVTGESNNGNIARLYENDGTGQFSPDVNFTPGVTSSSATFALVNNDIYDDIIYTGSPSGAPFFDIALGVYVNTQTAGVSDFGKEGLVLYPNPTRGVVNVKLSNDFVIDEVIVSDMSGRQFSVQMNGNQIDLSGLASGMYLVTLIGDDAVATKRIIKR